MQLENKSAVVIIPSTGNPLLFDAIKSVNNQTYKNVIALVVFDGVERYSKIRSQLYQFHGQYEKVVLSQITGANNFYGHRIFSALPHLVNQDYIFFLDEDNFLENNHVESMINTIEDNNLDWCYSLRNIIDKDGSFLCQDNCESLGKYKPVFDYHLVDTNCYCIKREVAIKISHAIHGNWGADRIFYQALSTYFPKFDCSGEYTINYRIGGNEGSVKKEFFEHWNKIVDTKYERLPWRK